MDLIFLSREALAPNVSVHAGAAAAGGSSVFPAVIVDVVNC
jgi:hypothetical protein